MASCQEGQANGAFCALREAVVWANSCRVADEHQIKLEYESAHFLQSLFGYDEKGLRYLEEKAQVRVVTRDGWLVAHGSEQSCELVQKVFSLTLLNRQMRF